MPGRECSTGLVIEDTTITRSSATTSESDLPDTTDAEALGNVLIDDVREGFRVSGVGDGVQGYDGNKLTIRNSTIAKPRAADHGP